MGMKGQRPETPWRPWRVYAIGVLSYRQQLRGWRHLFYNLIALILAVRTKGYDPQCRSVDVPSAAPPRSSRKPPIGQHGGSIFGSGLLTGRRQGPYPGFDGRLHAKVTLSSGRLPAKPIPPSLLSGSLGAGQVPRRDPRGNGCLVEAIHMYCTCCTSRHDISSLTRPSSNER